ITQQLIKALQLIEVRVLDHLIIGGQQIFSFAEHGLV
ncbi:JAB domain-containing protein, partial [Providencia stuartii]